MSIYTPAETRPLLIIGVAADLDPNLLDRMNDHLDRTMPDHRVLVVAGFTGAAVVVDRAAGTVTHVPSTTHPPQD